MRRLMVMAALAGAALARAETPMASGDQKFIEEAAVGGMLEVRLGQLAADKATDERVKAFGRQMVEDHGKANEELKSLVEGTVIPAELPADKQKKVDELAALEGPEFDRGYVKEMVADHNKDVKLFEKQARQAKSPELRAWAAKTLPVLKHHREMVVNLEKDLKRGKRAGR